jgi:elongation factor Ts
MDETQMVEIDVRLVKTLRDRTGAGVIACRKMLVETQGDLETAAERLRASEIAKAAKKADRVAAQGLVGLAVEGTRGAIVELNAETDFVARGEAFHRAAVSFARIALDVRGNLDALLNAPAPDGDGHVSDLIMRLTARTGEHINLRRSAFASVHHGVVASYVHNAAAPGLGSIGVLVALESIGPLDTVREIGHNIAMHIAASAPGWVSEQDIPPDVVAEKRSALTQQAHATGKPAGIVAKMVEGRMRRFYDETVLCLQRFVLDPDRRVQQVVREAEAAAAAKITISGFVRYRVGEGIEKASNEQDLSN